MYSVLFVLIRLTVPVQVTDWKDSSPKWPIGPNVLMGTLNPTHSLTHSFGRFRSNGMGLYRRVPKIFGDAGAPLLGWGVADPYKDVPPHVCYYRADFGRSSSNHMGVRSGSQKLCGRWVLPPWDGGRGWLPRNTHPFITCFITPILVALISAQRNGTFHTGGGGTGLSCYRLQF